MEITGGSWYAHHESYTSRNANRNGKVVLFFFEGSNFGDILFNPTLQQSPTLYYSQCVLLKAYYSQMSTTHSAYYAHCTLLAVYTTHSAYLLLTVHTTHTVHYLQCTLLTSRFQSLDIPGRVEVVPPQKHKQYDEWQERNEDPGVDYPSDQHYCQHQQPTLQHDRNIKRSHVVAQRKAANCESNGGTAMQFGKQQLKKQTNKPV